jgi:hypothetical protein
MSQVPFRQSNRFEWTEQGNQPSESLEKCRLASIRSHVTLSRDVVTGCLCLRSPLLSDCLISLMSTRWCGRGHPYFLASASTIAGWPVLRPLGFCSRSLTHAYGVLALARGEEILDWLQLVGQWIEWTKYDYLHLQRIIKSCTYLGIVASRTVGGSTDVLENMWGRDRNGQIGGIGLNFKQVHRHILPL